MKTTFDSETALNAKAQRRKDARMGARNSFRFSAAILIGLVLTVPPARGELLPIPLECQRAGNQLVLSWTNAQFTLQCAPTAHGVFTNIPGATSPHTNVFADAQCYFRLLGAGPPPANMVLIPAGSFTMGDCMDPSEGWSYELPLHTVYVSAFYMDKYEVTKAFWDEVYNWAVTHGYSFDYADSGQGKAANHPAQRMTWYDAVKWCNARSEKEGRTPAYYTSAAQTTVHRTGQVDVQADWVKWHTGYRLPTEAEWEKAARGGAGGRRFPWSDADTISHGRANYYSYWIGGVPYYPYDVSPTTGNHPTFNDGVWPYTSPVRYFAANGYGLHDMAGNVWEWCWDWWSSTYYSSSPGTDPRGPLSGSYRVIRGGSYGHTAIYCRTAHRQSYNPTTRGSYDDRGFRSVLPPGQ